MHSMKLTDLETGCPAKVLKVNGNDGFRERLCELGLSPGARVNLKARLPFNGPLVMRVESTTLALRKEEAEQIEVIV